MNFDLNTVNRERANCRIIFERNHFFFSVLSRGIFNSLGEAEEFTEKALKTQGRIFPRIPDKEPPNRFYCIVARDGDLLEFPFQVKMTREGKLIFIVKTVYRITETKQEMREKCLNMGT